jgi:tetratricopeptide (TPR) repeat protein
MRAKWGEVRRARAPPSTLHPRKIDLLVRSFKVKRALILSWLAPLAGLILVGCAGGLRDVPAARARPAWSRLRTDHFELVTDLAPPIALATATALERTRAALLQAAWSRMGNARQTERVRVIVLASEWEFRRYFGPTVDGVYSQLGTTAIVLGGTPSHWETRINSSDVFATSTLRHEIVHHLAAGIYGRQPRWFSEGLAQFLETIVVSGDGTKAIVGHPNVAALKDYYRVRSVAVKDALAWGAPSASQAEGEVDGLYGLSWLMVHWMFNTQPEAFAAYQQALARGDDAAWTHAFGTRDLDGMDRALYAYATHGEYLVHPVSLEPLVARATPVPIDAADVHAMLGQLALIGSRLDKERGELVEEAEQELGKALALEPGHVVALKLTRKPIPVAELLARLRMQTLSRPDDGEAWLLMAPLLSSPEREAALRKALTLLPGDSRAYNNLAWYLVGSGRGAEALPLATKAALLAPWDASVLDTYAACLFAVDRCADAARIEARAIDHLPEKMTPEGRRVYTSKLVRYRDACAAGSPRAAREEHS